MSVVILKKGEDINKLKSKMNAAREKMKGLNAKKYSGVIKLTEDPIAYQKRMRSEWNGNSD